MNNQRSQPCLAQVPTAAPVLTRRKGASRSTRRGRAHLETHVGRIGIVRGFAATRFGSLIVRTPLFASARTFSTSTSLGSVSWRWNAPNRRSRSCKSGSGRLAASLTPRRDKVPAREGHVDRGWVDSGHFHDDDRLLRRFVDVDHRAPSRGLEVRRRRFGAWDIAVEGTPRVTDSTRSAKDETRRRLRASSEWFGACSGLHSRYGIKDHSCRN